MHCQKKRLRMREGERERTHIIEAKRGEEKNWSKNILLFLCGNNNFCDKFLIHSNFFFGRISIHEWRSNSWNFFFSLTHSLIHPWLYYFFVSPHKSDFLNSNARREKFLPPFFLLAHIYKIYTQERETYSAKKNSTWKRAAIWTKTM